MADATWPPTLPTAALLTGNQSQLASVTVRTPMDSGAVKMRRRFTAGIKKHNWQFIFDGDQRTVFEHFYNATTSGGSLPFNLTLPQQPGAIIVDNGDPDFDVVSGSWSTSGSGYTGNANHTHAAGTTADKVRWTFTDLYAGTYQVWATWSEDVGNATDAPFTTFDDTVALTTSDLDQTAAPTDLTDAGAVWELVGATHVITGSVLKVELTADATATVVADAIRVRITAAPTVEMRFSQPPVMTCRGGDIWVASVQLEQMP